MGIEQIARVLINMSLDMDYADYKEHIEDEIRMIEDDIQVLKDSDKALFHLLETIAYANENITDLLGVMENEQL